MAAAPVAHLDRASAFQVEVHFCPQMDSSGITRPHGWFLCFVNLKFWTHLGLNGPKIRRVVSNRSIKISLTTLCQLGSRGSGRAGAEQSLATPFQAHRPTTDPWDRRCPHLGL